MTTNWPIMGSGKNLTNPPSTLGDPKQDTAKSLINYVIRSRWPLYRTHPRKDCVAGKLLGMGAYIFCNPWVGSYIISTTHTILSEFTLYL